MTKAAQEVHRLHKHYQVNVLPPSATDCCRLCTAVVGKLPGMTLCPVHLKQTTETLIQGHHHTRCGPACRKQRLENQTPKNKPSFQAPGPTVVGDKNCINCTTALRPPYC